MVGASEDSTAPVVASSRETDRLADVCHTSSPLPTMETATIETATIETALGNTLLRLPPREPSR